ncbi:hypothetical protein [Winogradskyella forsetii]|uniref:hypothetical protein n=1 Tax=Winogradskyella forsetii TaxID=2686077 RepID=UPI0015C129F4|nr:hypothetical protein [Winogradskyella forsetii]
MEQTQKGKENLLNIKYRYKMNIARITGLVLFILGICMISLVENEKFDFLSGILLGLGLGLTVIGRFKRRKSILKN